MQKGFRAFMGAVMEAQMLATPSQAGQIGREATPLDQVAMAAGILASACAKQTESEVSSCACDCRLMPIRCRLYASSLVSSPWRQLLVSNGRSVSCSQGNGQRQGRGGYNEPLAQNFDSSYSGSSHGVGSHDMFANSHTGAFKLHQHTSCLTELIN